MKALWTFVLVLLLTGCLHAQAPAGDDALWKQYFTWLKEGDPQARTPQAYRAKLIAEGMTEAQADERMTLLHQLSTQHELDFVELFFDRIYADPQAPFNTEPNAFLVSMTKDLDPGTALDVAMGAGEERALPGVEGLAGDRLRHCTERPGRGSGGSGQARPAHHHG